MDHVVQHARFTVAETFKGKPARISELRSGYGHGDCGVALVAGMDYLVLVEDDGIVTYCAGFFGPHFGWDDKSRFASERVQMLDRFAASIREHYALKAQISRSPPAELGIEDDSSRWFTPKGGDEEGMSSKECGRQR